MAIANLKEKRAVTDSEQTISIAPLLETAERLLSEHHQTGIVVSRSILLSDPGRRNRLWRCHLSSQDGVVPGSVIVKQVRPDGYAPADPLAWDTRRFFRDWAGARFLNDAAPTEAHGPALYGGDVELGFIVLEDLGEHTSLVEPLLDGDGVSAADALIAYARRLGRMHAACSGKEEQYTQVQYGISAAWASEEARITSEASTENEKSAAEFAAAISALGLQQRPGAQRELVAALSGLTAAGPFRTFVHGDPCPDNVFYRAPELRLIDFEFASFGHALRDGMYGRFLFPTCWCANSVPAEVLQQMESVYRAELSAVCPEILDEGIFGRESCAAGAFWTLRAVQGHIESVLEQDEEWGIAGTRGRVLSRIERFTELAGSAGQMPELCEQFDDLLAELKRRWPGAVGLPVYPAFRPEVGL